MRVFSGTTNVGDPPIGVDPFHRVQVSIRGKRFEMGMEVALASSMLFRLFFYTKWSIKEFQKLEEGSDTRDRASPLQNERITTQCVTLFHYLAETHPEVLFQKCMSGGKKLETNNQMRCSFEKEDRKKQEGIEGKETFCLEVFLSAFYARLVAPAVQSIMYECSTNGLQKGIEAYNRYEKSANTESDTLYDGDGSSPHHTHSERESPVLTGTILRNECENKAVVIKDALSPEMVAVWKKEWEVLQAMQNKVKIDEKKTIATCEEKGLLSNTTTAASSLHSSVPLNARSTEGEKVGSRSARMCPQDLPAYRFSLLPVSPWMAPQSITFEAESKTWVFKFSHRVTSDSVRERLVGEVIKNEKEVREGHASQVPSVSPQREQRSTDDCQNQHCRSSSQNVEQDQGLPSKAQENVSPRQEFSPRPLLPTVTSTLVSENIALHTSSSPPLTTSRTFPTCAASSPPLLSSLSSAALRELQPWVRHAFFTYFQQKQENTREDELPNTSMKTVLGSESGSTDEKEIQNNAEELHRRLNEDPWLQLQPEFAGVLWVFLRRLAQVLNSSKSFSNVTSGEKETSATPSFPTPPAFPLRWEELTSPQKVAVGALVQVLGVISLAPLISMTITSILPTVSASFTLPTGCAETCADLCGSSTIWSGGHVGPSISAGSSLSSSFQPVNSVLSSQQASQKGADRLETEKKVLDVVESVQLEDDLASLLPVACEKCGTLGHKGEECMFSFVKSKIGAP